MFTPLSRIHCNLLRTLLVVILVGFSSSCNLFPDDDDDFVETRFDAQVSGDVSQTLRSNSADFILLEDSEYEGKILEIILGNNERVYFTGLLTDEPDESQYQITSYIEDEEGRPDLEGIPTGQLMSALFAPSTGHPELEDFYSTDGELNINTVDNQKMEADFEFNAEAHGDDTTNVSISGGFRAIRSEVD